MRNSFIEFFLLVFPREWKVFPGNFVFQIYFHFWTFNSSFLCSWNQKLSDTLSSMLCSKEKRRKQNNSCISCEKTIKGGKWKMENVYQKGKKRTFNDFGWTCLFICWAKPLFKVEVFTRKWNVEKSEKLHQQFTSLHWAQKRKKNFQRRLKNFSFPFYYHFIDILNDYFCCDFEWESEERISWKLALSLS